MATPSNRPERDTAVRGAAAGAVAFVAGYVLTYAWRAPSVNDSLQGLNLIADLLGLQAIPTWKAVAWLFFGAHGVVTRFPTPTGGTQLVNMVEQSGDGTVAALYLLVPVVLLLAGAATARRADARAAGDGAIAGATVTIGYAVLAAAFTFLSSHAIGDTGATIAPDPVTGILLAGVVYPAVFGAIGGAVASYA